MRKAVCSPAFYGWWRIFSIYFFQFFLQLFSSSILRFTWWRMVLVLLAPLRSKLPTAICEDFNEKIFLFETSGKISNSNAQSNECCTVPVVLSHNSRAHKFKFHKFVWNLNFISCEIWSPRIENLNVPPHCIVPHLFFPPSHPPLISSFLYFRFVALPKNCQFFWWKILARGQNKFGSQSCV